MSKELFRALDGDVERLLVAGGGAAGADDGLMARREALAKLGEKVPFLAKMAEQAGKVAGAKARGAATELLNLSAMSMQLRGAQAGPRPVEGALGALAETAKLETPLPPFELEPLFYALTNSQPPGRDRGGIKRNKVIASAVERGAVHDLRLIELWIAALRDNGIGDTIVEDVIPKLGEASVPYVLAAYDPKGNAPDARRLRAVVTVRGAAARELVDRAFDEGSLAVKASALELLGRLDPPAAEAKALALIEDKNQVIRKACVRGLAKSKSDPALEALLKALDDTDEVREAAVKILGAFEHPKTTERLLGLLTPEALDIKPYKAPRAAAAAKKATKAVKRTATRRAAAPSKEERDALRNIEKKTEYAVAVMEALGPRPLTPPTLERLVPVFRQHAIEKLRVAAGEALLRSRDPKALKVLAEELTSDVYELRMISVNAFFRLDPTNVPARAKEFFGEAALKDKKGPDRAELILEELATPGYHLGDYEHYFTDKKKRDDDEDDDDDDDNDDDESTPKKEEPALDAAWVDVLLPALKHPKASKFHELYEALGRTRDARVVKPLSQLFETGKGNEHSIADALVAAGGKAAVPLFLKALADKRTRDAAASALGDLKAPEAVDPLLKLLQKAPSDDSTIVGSLGQIGDKRAAAPLVEYLDKLKTKYPGYVLQALRRLDDPSVAPALKAKAEKVKKVKSKAWIANQYEELINHLERDRVVS